MRAQLSFSVTRQQVLAIAVRRYQERTGRLDGLDIIRDELARRGIRRFSELDSDTERVALTMMVVDVLEKSV